MSFIIVAQMTRGRGLILGRALRWASAAWRSLICHPKAISRWFPPGHAMWRCLTERFITSLNYVRNSGLGHRFRGRSDTEVMLASFLEWGVTGAVTRFNGMFAVALWDCEQRLLHLMRDRVGKKPLYYGWVNRTFVFGSELKALRAHPDFRTDVDRDALTLYLQYAYVPSPRSIYKGIHKLPPDVR